MDLMTWVGLYAIELVGLCFILFGGGAEWFARSTVAGLLSGLWWHDWDAEQIKLYTWLVLIGTTIWFLLGVFVPACRFQW